MRKSAWALAIALVSIPSAVWAVSTRSFLLDDAAELDEGKLDGVISWSTGRLSAGQRTERLPIEEAAVAYASARGADGSVFVGSGHDGKIMRVRGKEVALFADLDASLVTALLSSEGTLYAGTLPGHGVLAIDGAGKVRTLAELPGVEQVWALARDPSGAIYAATGPEGKLFRVAKGKAELVYDDPAEHLLSLAIDEQRRVLVGTSDGARLLRVEGKRVRTLYDFPGEELTALAYAAGRVLVAANSFEDESEAGKVAQRKRSKSKRPKPGKGKVLVLEPNGHARELFASDDGHVSAIEIDAQGRRFLAGLASEGRVIELAPDGSSAVLANADERQIVALHMTEPDGYFLTSDGVALYRASGDARGGSWTSAVLDAGSRSRWGELSARGQGRLRLETRSGNTEKVDDSWSPFAPLAASAGPIKSPAGRFLQVRVHLSGDAELYALEAFYLPGNQPAVLRGVRLKPAKDKDDKQQPAQAERRSSPLHLTWDADPRDDDRLRFRLFYRREGQATFLPMLAEHEELLESEYAWSTRSIPDGYYRVRVEASDELDNPAPFATRVSALSAPLRVDNHAPELRKLRREGQVVRGEAFDAMGPIANLEVAIDGGPYRPIHPDDQLLDTQSERFTVELSSLPKDAQLLTVRATDAAGNVQVAALPLRR